MARYWWGDEDDQKHMHWFAWWKMCVSKNKGGMGFRDLHCFNLALLAKQSWRLLCEPESLCAQVLRAKYYPSGDILNADLKKGSSFTWQSVWFGLQTLKRGHIWRVGDGTSINIWSDAWIPSSPSRKILTPRGNTVYTKVSELIDPVTRSWDEELLRDLFLDVDVTRILKIPLAVGMMEDFVSWNYTNTGIFTVRTAYHIEWDHQHGRKLRRTNHQGSAAINPVWASLWALRVPAKMKIFSWRFVHGTIPCKAVLANRHIITSSLCPICQIHCEDTRHLFFQCPRAVEVWDNLGLSAYIEENCVEDRAGSGVFEVLLRRGKRMAPRIPDLGLQELIVIACWYLWWERRKIVHEEKVQKAAQSAQAISVLAINYFRALKKDAGIKRHGWEKPKEGCIKLNIDAAFSHEYFSGATGVVLRDDKGMFIAACSCGIEHVGDASTAEARALKDGLVLAGQMGCSKLEVNSDCMEVINTMTQEGNSAGPAAAIYEECAFLARGFAKVTFSHCPRESNIVAHNLAAKAQGYQSVVWIDEPPDFVIAELANDVSLFTM
jgi:ribonuclease HI